MVYVQGVSIMHLKPLSHSCEEIMPQYLGKSERARRLDFLLDDMEWFVIRLFMVKKAIIGWEQFKSPYQNIMHSSWLRIYSNDLHEAEKHAERIPHKERKGRMLSKPWARGSCDRHHVSRVSETVVSNI